MSSSGPVIICSLRSLEIELDDEIRQHLSDTYNKNKNNKNKNKNKTSQNNDNNDNNNNNTNNTNNDEATLPCREQIGDRLEGILSAMKRPPSFTTCRVNLIRATREEVRNELKRLLSPIPHLEVIEDEGFSDVLHIVPNKGAMQLQLQREKERERESGIEDSETPSDTRGELTRNCREPFLSDSTGPDNDDDEQKDAATVAPRTNNSNSNSNNNNSNNNSSNSSSNKDDSTAHDCLFPNWPLRAESGWPRNHRSIVCDRFCGEAVLRGSDIFVRGVLAADAGIREGETVAVYADVPKRGAAETTTTTTTKTTTTTVLRGTKLEHYQGKCVYLGLGRTACSRSEIFRKTHGVAVTLSSDPADRVGPPLPPLCGVLPDAMMLQNLPSVLVGHALNPSPGDVVLDMCAAPGGKTSHLASIVNNNNNNNSNNNNSNSNNNSNNNNRAVIVACDKSKKKVVAARDLFARMGATCITPLALDATNCCLGDDGEAKSIEQIIREAPIGKDGLKQIKKFPRESFDKILLDPPCSALGLRPKLFVAQQSLRELNKHAEYQRKFVSQAVRLLKPGGRMTYSTCTINGNENEGMVRHILREYPCMELLPIELPPSWIRDEIGLPGLDGFGLSEKERNALRRFDPDGVADTMGFFVALFRKRSSS